MIKAEIIADSISGQGHRITTFVLEFPRIVLAEFNTHRMLSRNSASSRAIPFQKMLRMVCRNPFVPIKWMKDHTGMQGSDFFNGTKAWLLRQVWLTARNFMVVFAWILSKLGLTKQIVNRLLEPFMWHRVIVTGTEWENFFALRADPPAEIHIQQLAYKMLEVYNMSTPDKLRPGQWHIPFGSHITHERLSVELYHLGGTDDQLRVKIATARCARVSYNNFEGKDDYTADIKLHDRLLSSGHMSPFEHCAYAMHATDYNYEKKHNDGWSGNFKGWVQYRKTLIGENKSDKRVTKN